MLLWGLAGFVNPVKSGKVFEQALGITQDDEFFKDNAIEVMIRSVIKAAPELQNVTKIYTDQIFQTKSYYKKGA